MRCFGMAGPVNGMTASPQDPGALPPSRQRIQHVTTETGCRAVRPPAYNMSLSSLPTDPRIYAVTALGSMLCIQCTTSFIDPIAAVRNFGLPLAPNRGLALVPIFAVRNASAGITAIILAWTGHVREAGLVLSVFAVCAGIGDVYSCLKYRGNWAIHAGGAAVFSAVGYWVRR